MSMSHCCGTNASHTHTHTRVSVMRSCGRLSSLPLILQLHHVSGNTHPCVLQGQTRTPPAGLIQSQSPSFLASDWSTGGHVTCFWM